MNELSFLFSCIISFGCDNAADEKADTVDIVPKNNIITKVDQEIIDKIKNTTYEYIDPNKKIGAILENRNTCSEIEWTRLTNNDNKDLILYRCHLVNYEAMFKTEVTELNKENKEIDAAEIKIPKYIEQDIVFNVSGETPIPVYCEFKYGLSPNQKITVLHPYCLRLSYDAEYTESWNDIVDSVITKQVEF